MGYYQDTFGFWVDYDYETYFEFPDDYEYYQAACHYYFDPDQYRGWYPLKYEAMFSCYPHFDVCDVYMSTKRLHAAAIEREMQSGFTDRAERAAELRDNYWQFINATYAGAWTDLDAIPEHVSCVEALSNFATGPAFPAAGMHAGNKP